MSKARKPAKMGNRQTERATQVQMVLVLSFERSPRTGALRPRKRWQRAAA